MSSKMSHLFNNLFMAEHVFESARHGRQRILHALVPGLGHAPFRFGSQAGDFIIYGALRLQQALEVQDGVALAPALDVLVLAVLAREKTLFRFHVAAPAIGARLDEGRTGPAARAR